jgi:hypothetical protein
MHVISDPSDGFSAIPSKEVLVSLANETCLNNITSLLSTLYELFPIESAPRLACFGAAMAAAVDALVCFVYLAFFLNFFSRILLEGKSFHLQLIFVE